MSERENDQQDAVQAILETIRNELLEATEEYVGAPNNEITQAQISNSVAEQTSSYLYEPLERITVNVDLVSPNEPNQNHNDYSVLPVIDELDELDELPVFHYSETQSERYQLDRLTRESMVDEETQDAEAPLDLQRPTQYVGRSVLNPAEHLGHISPWDVHRLREQRSPEQVQAEFFRNLAEIEQRRTAEDEPEPEPVAEENHEVTGQITADVDGDIGARTLEAFIAPLRPAEPLPINVRAMPITPLTAESINTIAEPQRAPFEAVSLDFTGIRANSIQSESIQWTPAKRYVFDGEKINNTVAMIRAFQAIISRYDFSKQDIKKFNIEDLVVEKQPTSYYANSNGTNIISSGQITLV